MSYEEEDACHMRRMIGRNKPQACGLAGKAHWYTLQTLEACAHSTSYLPTFSHLLTINKLFSRRCTYRPSVIYLIVNKLLSLSLSLSHTHTHTLNFSLSLSLSLSVCLYSHYYPLVIPGCAMPRVWRRRETLTVFVTPGTALFLFEDDHNQNRRHALELS